MPNAALAACLVLLQQPAVSRPSLTTRWTAEVTPEHVLPEYPRPDLVRPTWQTLNGTWQYAVRDSGSTSSPRAWDGTILVPFPIESQLSGVRRTVTDRQRLWYRRTFRIPSTAAGTRWLLHFGAVDWEAIVSVNGRRVGAHRGGYDPFTLDITGALRPAPGDQELVVRVWDPTDRGDQPRGKQVLKPQSIWYTAVTGIWQTVWLEPVPRAYITTLDVRPDVDAGTVSVRVAVSGTTPAASVQLAALDGDSTVARGTGPPGQPLTLYIPAPKLWGPGHPFLYGLRVRLGDDTVTGYFGMRKIAVARDGVGRLRLFLNNHPLFEYGTLDQGWWPDGLYTAPTDAALRSDIETLQHLGFNLIRKHVKVEPARWYYHCDQLGMLVWQDMPSGDNKTPAARQEFADELDRVVAALRNHPAIVMWVPFNEGWGQHDTRRIVARLKQRDATRLVDNASGWTDAHVGDVLDIHDYPGPALPPPDSTRASVLGEFGGLGLPIEGHTWQAKDNWGYRRYANQDELSAAYRALLDRLRSLESEGLAAAVYTQTSDVEIEVNGVMTYDREIVKLAGDMAAVNRRLQDPQGATVTRAPFGRTAEGIAVEAYTLTNPQGMQVRVITYGAILQAIRVPDRAGRVDDVALGHDDLQGYLTNAPYFGAIVGRYANRIAQGRFTLDGTTYRLATNNGPNHLHGGTKGFDKAVWQAEPFQQGDTVGVRLSHTSPAGDEGYPGTLAARVTYSLTPASELVVDYMATTDQATPVNLSQHTYFNLGGVGGGDILRHILSIDADRYTPVDSTLIPTGELASVAGTPLDFRAATAIGARIEQPDPQLKRGRGYDHNFVLNRTGSGLAHAAHVLEPTNGRTLDIFTTEPGLQFYSGNFLDGTITGKGGHAYQHRSGFCLETQHFPDSPNHLSFPSTILRPGAEYRSRTVFAFGVSR